MSSPHPTRLIPRWLVALATLLMVATACSASPTTVVNTSAADQAANEAAGLVGNSATDDSAEASDPIQAVEDTGVTLPEDDADPVQNSTSGTFEASASYLANAALQVQNAESMKFEVFSEIESSAFGPMTMGSRTEPFITGEAAGEQASVNMDMNALMGPLAAMLGNDVDFGMRMVTDGTTVYMNAPFFGSIMQLQGGATDPQLESSLGWMQTVADGWGKIEMGGLIDEADVLGNFGMQSGGGATEMLELLQQVGDVQDGGRSEVRGVPTQVVLAAVSMQELIALLGQDMETEFAADPMFDEIAALDIDLEVHVDDAGLVRRVEYAMDLGSIIPEDEFIGDMSMSMWQRADYFAFGEPVSIDIPSGAEDITADFMALINLAGG